MRSRVPLLLTAIYLLGCFAVLATANCVFAQSAADAPAQEVTRIGLVLPLTGPLAEYGIAVKNGIEVASQAEPALFKSLKFFPEDSQYVPKNAVSAFQKLVTQDRVNLIYNWGGPTSDAVSPLADRLGIPLITWTADPKTSTGRKFVIRFTNPAAEFAKVLQQHLQSKGYKKLAVVKAENHYLNGLLDGLQEVLAPDQTLDILDNYQMSDQDFRPTVTKLKNSKYDAIGIYLISGQVSQFYRQMKQQQVEAVTFGTDFFESATEIASAEGMMEGAFYANNTVSPAFLQSYEKQFGNDLRITHAGNGHDFAMLIARLFAGQSAPAADQIMEKVRATGPQDGVGGKFAFANTAGDQHFSFPVVIKHVKDGRITE